MIRRATPLNIISKLAPPCRCAACSHGCTMGSGFLAQGDISPMARFLGVSEEELKKKYLEEVEQFHTKLWRPNIERTEGKQYGKCTFFSKEKGCTVHQAKPLQCKVSMGCKPYSSDLHAWFMLNHMVNPTDPESIRQYADYLKADGTTIQGGKLEELVPDKKKLKEILSFELLK